MSKKGFKHSEETKRKISESKKGQPSSLKGSHMSEEIKQKHRIAITGKKHSEEAKRRMSISKKGMLSGDKNPNWKGGVSKVEGYESLWKQRYSFRKKNIVGSYTHGEWELLKEQYDYSCPSCGRMEPEIILAADHVIPITKGGCNNISNIQPLCGSCNSRKHTKIFRITPEGELMLF